MDAKCRNQRPTKCNARAHTHTHTHSIDSGSCCCHLSKAFLSIGLMSAGRRSPSTHFMMAGGMGEERLAGRHCAPPVTAGSPVSRKRNTASAPPLPLGVVFGVGRQGALVDPRGGEWLLKGAAKRKGLGYAADDEATSLLAFALPPADSSMSSRPAGSGGRGARPGNPRASDATPAASAWVSLTAARSRRMLQGKEGKM